MNIVPFQKRWHPTTFCSNLPNTVNGNMKSCTTFLHKSLCEQNQGMVLSKSLASDFFCWADHTVSLGPARTSGCLSDMKKWAQVVSPTARPHPIDTTRTFQIPGVLRVFCNPPEPIWLGDSPELFGPFRTQTPRNFQNTWPKTFQILPDSCNSAQIPTSKYTSRTFKYLRNHLQPRSCQRSLTSRDPQNVPLLAKWSSPFFESYQTISNHLASETWNTPRVKTLDKPD